MKRYRGRPLTPLASAVATAIRAGRLEVLVGLTVLASVGAAQPRPDAPLATWDIAPYIGVAQHSPVGNDWGVTEDRSHLFLGVHLRTPVARAGGVQLFYAPNITPLLRLTHHRSAGSTEPWEAPAHAIGIAPFGIALGIPINQTVRVLGTAAVGALWFDRVVPIADARAFNVSLEWGGSIEWVRRSGPAIELGYKFHHLSNVYTAEENPGVDANVFFLGGRWRRTIPR